MQEQKSSTDPETAEKFDRYILATAIKEMSFLLIVNVSQYQWLTLSKLFDTTDFKK